MAFSIRLPRPRMWWHIFIFAQHISDAPAHTAVASSGSVPANSSAFEAFFWRYERQITAYLCRMTGDEQAASDLCQETFFRAWQHFEQIREGTEGRGWLFRVATNLALHHLRHQRAHPSVLLDDELPGASDPGGRVIQQDLINQTLQRLTPQQRSALLLHEVNGLECEEIGKMLGISRAAVKMALWRAREQFRVHYLRERSASDE